MQFIFSQNYFSTKSSLVEVIYVICFPALWANFYCKLHRNFTIQWRFFVITRKSYLIILGKGTINVVQRYIEVESFCDVKSDNYLEVFAQLVFFKIGLYMRIIKIFWDYMLWILQNKSDIYINKLITFRLICTYIVLFSAP